MRNVRFEPRYGTLKTPAAELRPIATSETEVTAVVARSNLEE
jgi:hypothetical protein